jgi:hypothetical protein
VHFYCVSGLIVSSDLALPGLNAAPAGHGAPEVTIRAGAVPDALANPSGKGLTWQIAGQSFLLSIPGIARVLLSEGRDIVYAAEPDGDPADIPIFILGPVFGILLHQRQQVVLHASAVRVGDRAILFCGRSGSGKSTLAAALSKRGYPLLTDDVCALSIEAQGARRGVPMVHPDGRQLKLWAEAIDVLDFGASRGERVRSRLEKFYVEPDRAHGGAVPLAAVYILREARPPFVSGIERANAVDAARLLRRVAYRPTLVRRMNQNAGYFHAAAAIANSGGMFLLTRSINFAEMPQVIGWLEQHWRDLGLMERAA